MVFFTIAARHLRHVAPRLSSLRLGDVSHSPLSSRRILTYPPAGANMMGSDLYDTSVNHGNSCEAVWCSQGSPNRV